MQDGQKIFARKFDDLHRKILTDKKLLQNVNDRMKQNRKDYSMKICGKIDNLIKNNRFLDYFEIPK